MRLVASSWAKTWVGGVGRSKYTWNSRQRRGFSFTCLLLVMLSSSSEIPSSYMIFLYPVEEGTGIGEDTGEKNYGAFMLGY